MTEGRILLLKARQRRLGLPSRNGWLGDAQRLLETWLATEERSYPTLPEPVPIPEPKPKA